MIAHLYEAPGWGTGALLVERGRIVDHEEPRDAYRPPVPVGRSAQAEPVARRLVAYYAGAPEAFDDLSLGPACARLGLAADARALLEAVRRIPRGETRSYAEVARSAGRARGWRAAGRVCAEGPLSVIVPYHRVIRADGGIGGYGELGVARKRRLLELEGARAG